MQTTIDPSECGRIWSEIFTGGNAVFWIDDDDDVFDWLIIRTFFCWTDVRGRGAGGGCGGDGSLHLLPGSTTNPFELIGASPILPIFIRKKNIRSKPENIIGVPQPISSDFNDSFIFLNRSKKIKFYQFTYRLSSMSQC